MLLLPVIRLFGNDLSLPTTHGSISHPSKFPELAVPPILEILLSVVCLTDNELALPPTHGPTHFIHLTDIDPALPTTHGPTRVIHLTDKDLALPILLIVLPVSSA